MQIKPDFDPAMSLKPRMDGKNHVFKGCPCLSRGIVAYSFSLIIEFHD